MVAKVAALLLVAVYLLCACHTATAQGTCTAPKGASQGFIDPATLQCTKSLCKKGDSSCPPEMQDMELVFSDEFNKAAPNLGTPQDKRWTAMDMYYSNDYKEYQVYKPDNVAVEGGALQITLEDKNNQAILYKEDGEHTVKSNITSGMLQTWNKFCFTGGYVDFSIKLPGSADVPGFWAAAWLMGNLGRAGYYKSLEGVWPFSYDACDDGAEIPPWTNKTAQRISNCNTQPKKGRGAPEIDVLEFGVLGGDPATGKPGTPEYVHTLQIAPVAPKNTSWRAQDLLDKYGEFPGITLLGQNTYLPNTNAGPMSTDGYLRPGSEITDTISASTPLLDGKDYYNEYHNYSVYWEPGERIRWYLDDKPLFEVTKQALQAQENKEGDKISERLISLEPMYLILNLAMAKDGWAKPDWNKLKPQLPGVMAVDYVRVYQSRGKINVGCDAPGFETSQYISCNRSWYLGGNDRAWSLPLCKSVSAPENSFLIGLGAAIVAVSLTALVMIATMRSYLKRAEEGVVPSNLEGRSGGLKASPYIPRNHQQVHALLKHTRPDLLAVAQGDSAARRRNSQPLT